MRRAVAILALVAACGHGGDSAESAQRERLSQTGLYRDIAAKTLKDDLVLYEPAYSLWSDGAGKRRWMRLPRGTQIDTSDPEHWRFPVGTQFFKEFSLDGVLLETRLIERVADTGDDAADYWLGAFVWLPDGSDAVLAPDGASDVNGTQHDVPSQTRCMACHQGEPGHILGFSSVQLSKDDGVSLEWLAQQNLLSDPPDQPYVVPGDGPAPAALGTLHANCGHCHNPNGVAWPDVQVVLRLATSERTVAETELYRTTVGVPAQLPTQPLLAQRIVPGNPDESELFHRMGQRGNRDQMPPIATEIPDPQGLEWVREWIRSLSP